MIGQVVDALFALQFNFTGGPEPPCRAACDSNGDGAFIGQVADAIGVERVVMGSDFPHAEGLADPIRFVDELKEFDADLNSVGLVTTKGRRKPAFAEFKKLHAGSLP